jgi:hypothetical protein
LFCSRIATLGDSHTTLLAVHAEWAHICAMPGAKVMCTCGAIYEVIETKGPSRDAQPFKCCLCDRELFAWEGGQLHLVWRPDEDRE